MKKITILSIFLCLLAVSLHAQHLKGKGKSEATDKKPATTYSIGDFAQGGVVFWVTPDGKYGKVVSIYDAGAMRWSNVISKEVGRAAQSATNGAGNTKAITLQDGHKRSAALHCSRLEYGGYNDWYLPSKDELSLINKHSAVINDVAKANGGEVFARTSYWSSTEINGKESLGWLIGKDDAGDIIAKDTARPFRAVRTF